MKYKPGISIYLDFCNVHGPPSFPIAQCPVFLGSDSGTVFTSMSQWTSISPGSRFNYATNHTWKQQVNTVFAIRTTKALSGDYPQGKTHGSLPLIKFLRAFWLYPDLPFVLEELTELRNYV